MIRFRYSNFLWCGSLITLWISVSVTADSSTIATGHLCDLRNDTVQKSDNPTQYFKCEPKHLKKGMEHVGEWNLHDCKLESMDECLAREKNAIKKAAASNNKLDKPAADSVDYDYYNAGVNNFIPLQEKQCIVSSPPSPGASCCLSQSDVLEADPTNVRYYLQCNPSQEGVDFGVWIRMECPFGTAFNAASQSCGPNFAQFPISSSSNSSAVSKSSVSTIDFPTCPDGKKTNLFCNEEYCPKDYECYKGGCCPKKQTTAVELSLLLCPDQTQPVSACTKRIICPGKYFCNFETDSTDQGFCCKLPKFSYCPGNTRPLNIPPRCSEDWHCPDNSFCMKTDFVCCPKVSLTNTFNFDSFTATRICSDGTPPQSICNTHQPCPSGLHCTSENICCSLSSVSIETSPLACPDGGRPTATPSVCSSVLLCPIGYVCSSSKRCCPLSNQLLCADGSAPLPFPTSCSDSDPCPRGFECTASKICCVVARTNFSDAQSLPQTTVCPDGTLPLSSPQICSSRVPCPSNYKCTLEQMCCKSNEVLLINVFTCPDGTPAAESSSCHSKFDCPENNICIEGHCCKNNVVEVQTEQIGNLGIHRCPDGTLPLTSPSTCLSNGNCPQDFICTSGLCCGTKSCPGGYKPFHSPPICSSTAPCPSGYLCASNNVCCPNDSIRRCPDDSIPLSLPDVCLTTSDCPVGFSCTENHFCCETRICADGSLALSEPKVCGLNNPCPPHFQCSSTFICCPIIVPSSITCPDGSVPLAIPAKCSENVTEECPTHYFCDSKSNACCKRASLKSPNLSTTTAPTTSTSTSISTTTAKPTTTTQRTTSQSTTITTTTTPTTTTTTSSQVKLAVQQNANASSLPKPQLQPPLTNPYGVSNPPVVYQSTYAPNVIITTYTTPPTTPTTTPQVQQPAKTCPDGSLPSLVPPSCFLTTDCPAGSACLNFICCQQAPTCADGSAPLPVPARCGGTVQCPNGYSCTNGVCCIKLQQTCSDGSQPLPSPLSCTVSSNCSPGYTCTLQGICCRDRSCPDGSTALPQPAMCSSVTTCPTGYSCTPNMVCCVQRTCPDGSAPAPSITCSVLTPCPAGYSCQNSVCCQTGNLTQQCSSGQPNSYGQNCVSPQPPISVTCPDGSSPQGECQGSMANVCPVGYACQNFLCCRTSFIGSQCPNGQPPAISPPQCSGYVQCPPGYSCQNSVCCGASLLPSNCPDGSQSVQSCPCPQGYQCINTGCCLISVPMQKCLDGSPALTDPCNSGLCPTGFQCQNNLCCGMRTCPDGVEALSTPASCNSAADCPLGYMCVAKLCCRMGQQSMCPGGATPTTMCSVQAPCATGLICLNAVCCPIIVQGFCPDGTMSMSLPSRCDLSTLCPVGFTCTNGFCCQSRMCPDGSEALSSPASCSLSSPCPIGYTCGGTVCCRNQLCPDGSVPAPSQPICGLGGAGQVCPPSFNCVGGLCCTATFIPARCPDGSNGLQLPSCSLTSPCPNGYLCLSGACCQTTPVSGNCPQGLTQAPGITCGSYAPACPSGYTCYGNVCCRPQYAFASLAEAASVEVSTAADLLAAEAFCPDGNPPLSTCKTNEDTCPRTFLCIAGLCCASICYDGTVAAQQCKKGYECAAGFSCVNALCCSGPPKCANGRIGLLSPNPCTRSTSNPLTMCPNGYQCSQRLNLCCPNNRTLCPDGSKPSRSPNSCRSSFECPSNFGCTVNHVCCPLSTGYPYSVSTRYTPVLTETPIFVSPHLPVAPGYPNSAPTLPQSPYNPTRASEPPKYSNFPSYPNSPSFPSAPIPASPPNYPNSAPTVVITEKPYASQSFSEPTKPPHPPSYANSAPPATEGYHQPEFSASPKPSSGPNYPNSVQPLTEEPYGSSTVSTTPRQFVSPNYPNSAPTEPEPPYTSPHFSQPIKPSEYPNYQTSATSPSQNINPSPSYPRFESALPETAGYPSISPFASAVPRYPYVASATIPISLTTFGLSPTGPVYPGSQPGIQSQICPDGRLSVRSCAVDHVCPISYVCLNDLCCDIQRPSLRICPTGEMALPEPLSCVNDLNCPFNFACFNGLCCSKLNTGLPPTPPLDGGRCPDGSLPLPEPSTCGPETVCPNGFACAVAIRKCCRFLAGKSRITNQHDSNAVGKRAKKMSPCPNGFSFLEINGTCNMFNPCPSGAVCLAGICCDYHSSLQIIVTPNGRCPNNVDANGLCATNDVCPENYTCSNGFCCFAPNTSFVSSTEVSVSFVTKGNKCSDDTSPLNLPYFCNSAAIRCPSNFYCYQGFCCGSEGLTLTFDTQSSNMSKWRILSRMTSKQNVISFDREGRKSNTTTKAFCPDGSGAYATCNFDNECSDGFGCVRIVDKSYCCRQRLNGNHDRIRQQYISYQTASCPGAISPAITITICSTGSQCPTGFYCPYTTGICCPSTRLCQDGAQPLSTKCEYDRQCPTGYFCFSTVGACCRQMIRNCPDNSPSSQNTCLSDSQCPADSYCPFKTGACCKKPNQQSVEVGNINTLSVAMRCPGGYMSLNIPCTVNSNCPNEFYCAISIGVCCQNRTRTCPDGNPSLPALCRFDSDCVAGYYCPSVTGACCPGKTGLQIALPSVDVLPLPQAVASAVCPGGSLAFQKYCTRDSVCPENHFCLLEHKLCCPVPKAKVCSNGAEPLPLQCPPNATCGIGLYCDKILNVCCPSDSYNFLSCPSGDKPLERFCSVDSDCPASYFCSLDLHACCVDTRASCPDRSKSLAGFCDANSACPQDYYCLPLLKACCKKSSASLSPSRQNCPDGTQAVGPCINGQCGVGFTCLNNLCCRSRTCPDGTTALTTACTVDSQCPPSYYCPASTLFCCLQTTTTTVAAQTCTDGSTAVGSCINGQCGPGFTCNTATNLCCTSTAQLCTDNSQPAGACIGGLCGNGFTCNALLNLCCATRVGGTTTCLDGSTPVGPCVNGLCGVNSICTTGNLCCPTAAVTTTPTTCPDGSQPVGICMGGLCATGFQCIGTNPGNCCVTATPFLCPTTNLASTERCTAALTCVTTTLICIDGTNCCPNPTPAGGNCAAGAQDLGPCVPPGLCPSGFNCNTASQRCCSQRRSVVVDNYQPDLMEYPEPEIRCKNGQYVVAACRNGLCEAGYTCEIENNFCCPVIQPRIPNTNVVWRRDFDRTISVWSHWQTWSTCNNGVQSRRRRCLLLMRNNFSDRNDQNNNCSGLPFDERACPKIVLLGMKKQHVPQPVVHHSGLRPGARCAKSHALECNGASKGIAACLNGLCTCLPPAVKAGNTCYLSPKPARIRGPFYAPRSVLLGLMNDDVHSNLTEFENVTTQKICSNMSDCNAHDHEQCINGVCISPKGPGDLCVNKMECVLNCPASDCVEESNSRKICVCNEKLYKYGRRCMKKCPQGTRSKLEKRDCEDTIYSRLLHDSPMFEKDLKQNNAC